MYEDGLAATGAGALLVGGHTIGLPELITVTAGVMMAGLLVYRFATRGRRAATRA